MSAVEEWDISLTPNVRSRILQTSLPAAISRALLERGCNRAKVTVTAEGILFRPYKSATGARAPQAVILPDWDAS